MTVTKPNGTVISYNQVKLPDGTVLSPAEYEATLNSARLHSQAQAQAEEENRLLNHLHFCLRRMSGVSTFLAERVGPGSPLPDGVQKDIEELAQWASGAQSDIKQSGER